MSDFQSLAADAPSVEDLFNAAVQVAAAEAKVVVVRQGADYAAARGMTLSAYHDAAETVTSEHIRTILGLVLSDAALLEYLADTMAAAAYEWQREAEGGPEDLMPLERHVRGLLARSFVVDRRGADLPPQEARFCCDICDGLAETEAGVPHMHDICCPLNGYPWKGLPA